MCVIKSDSNGFRRRAPVVLAWFAAALAFSACDAGTTTNPVSASPVRIVILPQSPVIAEVDSVDFGVVGITSSGDTVPFVGEVTWSVTSDSGIVRGNGKGGSNGNGYGRFKPKGPGKTDVVATSDSLADTTTVTATAVAVASVSVSPSSPAITQGQAVQLSAAAYDSTGTPLEGRTASWESADPQVASVDSGGVVTAFELGTTTVDATIDGVSGTSVVEVAAADTTGDSTSAVTAAFQSDWGTATGSGVAALVDGNQVKPWTVVGDPNHLLRVVDVATEGLDFPSKNVLKVVVDSGMSSENWAQPQFRTSDGYLPVPGVGESLYWRYYVRIVVPDAYDASAGADHLTHGTQDGDNFGERNWQHEIVTHADGTFRLRIAVTNGINSNLWPDYFWWVDLRKGETYRVEMQISRTGLTTFALHARVFDVRGTLLFGDADFRNDNGSATLASTPTLEFGDPGAPALAALRTGLNGLGDAVSGVFPFTFGYWGAWAVCTNDWCGPYNGSF